jgi:hypothetical protein
MARRVRTRSSPPAPPAVTRRQSSETVALATQLPQCHGHCHAWPGWKSTGMHPSNTASTTALRVIVSPGGMTQKVLFQ